MKFNKAKCKFLHLGQGNLEYQCRLGHEGIENHPVEKDLGSWWTGLEKEHLQPRKSAIAWAASQEVCSAG